MDEKVFSDNGMSQIHGGVIHVGAHECEEMDFYDRRNADYVLWVEANPAKWPIIEKKIGKRDSQILVKSAAGSENGVLEFSTYNRSEYNSVLLPGGGDPHMVRTGSLFVVVKTLDQIIADSLPISRPLPVLLTMDVQGYEAKVVAGAGNILGSSSLKWIYSEICWKNYYEGQITQTELEEILFPYGFRLASIDHEGGDEWGNLLFKKTK
jgi:FkbM family methyltransferase